MKDVVVDYRYSRKLNISLGYSKKILGVEYEDGKRKRIPIHRSFPYRKMESLGIVGRQLISELTCNWERSGITPISLRRRGATTAGTAIRNYRSKRHGETWAWAL
jgi:hypothetical protein